MRMKVLERRKWTSNPSKPKTSWKMRKMPPRKLSLKIRRGRVCEIFRSGIYNIDASWTRSRCCRSARVSPRGLRDFSMLVVVGLPNSLKFMSTREPYVHGCARPLAWSQCGHTRVRFRGQRAHTHARTHVRTYSSEGPHSWCETATSNDVYYRDYRSITSREITNEKLRVRSLWNGGSSRWKKGLLK